MGIPIDKLNEVPASESEVSMSAGIFGFSLSLNEDHEFELPGHYKIPDKISE